VFLAAQALENLVSSRFDDFSSSEIHEIFQSILRRNSTEVDDERRNSTDVDEERRAKSLRCRVKFLQCLIAISLRAPDYVDHWPEYSDFTISYFALLFDQAAKSAASSAISLPAPIAVSPCGISPLFQARSSRSYQRPT
jgi:hypothetical protein